MTSSVAYKYQLLPSSQHIRLIHIQPEEYSAALSCHITIHSQDSSPPYSALSYTWGSPVQDCFIICDGQHLGITLNLGKALRNLRHSTETRTFWIDAVCIDQKNIEERNSQVRLMKDIYQSAREVVIWLGEDKEDRVDAASLLPRIHTAAVDGKLFQGPDSLDVRLEQAGLPGFDSPVWLSLAELYRRSWFTRVWVVQELAVAKPATVFCGGCRVLWACFTPAALCLESAARVHPWDGRFRFDLDRLRYMDTCHARFKDGVPTRLLDVLSTTRSHFSMDPRDKVFAVLGLASDANALFPNPDYSESTSEVYSTLTINMIVEGGSLEVLSHKEDPWFTGIKGLSSWVVDWSVHPRSHSLQSTAFYQSYQASGDSRARVRRSTTDPSTLYVTGLQIDKIKESGMPCLRYEPRLNMVGTKLRQLKLNAYNYSTSMYLEQARWEQWERIALKLKSYPTGEDLFEAYIRTLAGALEMREPTHDLRFIYQAYLKFWDCLRDKDPIYCNGDASKEICTHWIWFRDAIEDVAGGRLLFTSDNGYIGLAPPSSRPGDLVCLLLGGRTPFILRPDGKKHYRLIGDCYLHGQMQRNMEGTDDQLQEFGIH